MPESHKETSTVHLFPLSSQRAIVNKAKLFVLYNLRLADLTTESKPWHF